MLHDFKNSKWEFPARAIAFELLPALASPLLATDPAIKGRAMVRQIILLLLAFLAEIPGLLAGEASPAGPRSSITVRVVATGDNLGTMMTGNLIDPKKVSLDLQIPLAGFTGSTAEELYLSALEKSGTKRSWFVCQAHILRLSSFGSAYLTIDRMNLSSRPPFLALLKDGDIVAFHGQRCYFGTPPPR
jgi:hypothetical protein